MFTRKQFQGIAVFTLFIFTCFTLTLDYSYSQEENPLLKAQGLYKQGNFIEAVKVLEVFIGKIKGNPSEKKRLAEANLLLARIYYEAGEDARVADYMKQAVEAYADIGKEEGNLDFKARLERVREARLKSQAAKKETTPVVTKETAKTEAAQPNVQEKEKPAPQIKKKKKFPWLLVILGVGAVVILVVLLTKKKKQTLTVTVGEGVMGNPAAGSYSYNKGDSVPYTYSLSTNSYENLQVQLDGNVVAASGNVIMNSNHTISVSATKEATFENGALTVKGVRYELASIPAGEFQMGSNSLEAYDDEKPVHTVRISKSFWIGKTEVTQGLWQAVQGSNPSYFKKGNNYPVEEVSWDDCQAFITKLNQMVGGNAFRLPTEGEWEYACRAGTTGDRYGDIDAIAWYSSNSGNTTHIVGQKQANAWGLNDTLGNVYEWCQDWYGAYSAGYQIDPTGPGSGAVRVVRGGSWYYSAGFVRSTIRFGLYSPGYHGSDLGFRLARTN